MQPGTFRTECLVTGCRAYKFERVKIKMNLRKKVSWRLSMIGERMLDFMPFAYRIHGLFERTKSDEYLNFVQTEGVKGRINHWKFFYDNISCKLNSKKVLEIGTGWSGIDLILLHLFGVSDIYSIDKAAHLDLKVCKAGLEGLKESAGEIENTFGIDDVLNKLIRIPTDTLNAFLKHIKVHYCVGKELNEIYIEKSTIDLFYTYSCLQIIPLTELRRLLEAVTFVLKQGAILYNDVRFIDNNYKVQENLNPFGYLQYSDWLWNLIQSRKFNYHNRLRHSEFLKLMCQYGFELVAERNSILDKSLIQSVKLDKRFAAVDINDLVIANASMIHSFR